MTEQTKRKISASMKGNTNNKGKGKINLYRYVRSKARVIAWYVIRSGCNKGNYLRCRRIRKTLMDILTRENVKCPKEKLNETLIRIYEANEQNMFKTNDWPYFERFFLDHDRYEPMMQNEFYKQYTFDDKRTFVLERTSRTT